VVNLMAMFLHFTRQTRFVSRMMADHIQRLQASLGADDVDREAPRAQAELAAPATAAPC
jgi:hypothetical protein